MGLRRIISAALLAGLMIPQGAWAQGRTFFAEGTDTATAAGARALAMGGTGTAISDDPHAMYYNPALLPDLDRPMAVISRQIGAELRPTSFIGITTPVSLLEPLGVKTTIGFASFPRVHSRSTGAFREDEPQSIFLRFLLPGMAGTYDGDIDSKTIAWRFGVGFQPVASDWISVGLSADYIDCKSSTCGVNVTGGYYEERTIRAVAYGLNAGIRIKPTKALSFAASVQDINTKMYGYGTVTTPAGTREKSWVSVLPRTTSFEASWQASDRLLLALAYRQLKGDYGQRTVNITTLNFGAEYGFDNGWTLRGGAWRPMQISIAIAPGQKLPIPFVPALGAGWQNEHFSLDAALYVHPIMTVHHGFPAPTAELSIGYRF